MAPAQHRRSITLKEKREIVTQIEGKQRTRRQVAEEFGIGMTTVSLIMKRRSDFLGTVRDRDGNVFMDWMARRRSPKYGRVDVAMERWVLQMLADKVPVSGTQLKQKAREIASFLGIVDFKASGGWLRRFLVRKGFLNICSPRNSLESKIFKSEVDHWHMTVLARVLHAYPPSDIYSADEAGLFYRCLPNRVPLFKGASCSAGQYAEERVTVLIGTNMTGTDKLQPFVVGHWRIPAEWKRGFNYPVPYVSNARSWMTSELFCGWLSELDHYFSARNKRICLFIDTLDTHMRLPPLRSVEIVYIPLEISSMVHPFEQGIVHHLKVNYRSLLVQWQSQKLQAGVDLSELRLRFGEALRFLLDAWTIVSQEIVLRSFRIAGFSDATGLSDPTDPSPYVHIEMAFKQMKALGLLDVDISSQDYIQLDDELIVSRPSSYDDEEDVKAFVDRTGSTSLQSPLPVALSLPSRADPKGKADNKCDAQPSSKGSCAPQLAVQVCCSMTQADAKL